MRVFSWGDEKHSFCLLDSVGLKNIDLLLNNNTFTYRRNNAAIHTRKIGNQVVSRLWHDSLEVVDLNKMPLHGYCRDSINGISMYFNGRKIFLLRNDTIKNCIPLVSYEYESIAPRAAIAIQLPFIGIFEHTPAVHVRVFDISIKEMIAREGAPGLDPIYIDTVFLDENYFAPDTIENLIPCKDYYINLNTIRILKDGKFDINFYYQNGVPYSMKTTCN